MKKINFRAAGFIWVLATILPFVSVLTTIDLLSNGGVLKNAGIFHLVIYFIPSYLILFFIEGDKKEKRKHYAFFTAYLIILFPLVFLFELAVTCSFHGCTLP